MKHIKNFESFYLDSDTKILVRDIESNKILEWTIGDILDEINRDRSSDWEDFTIEDWLDGWNDWVDGEFYSIYDEHGNHLNDFIKTLEDVKDYNM